MTNARTHTVLFVVFLTGAAAAFLGLAGPAEMSSSDSDEYAVWSAVLNQWYLKVNSGTVKTLVRNQTALYPITVDHFRKYVKHCGKKDKGCQSIRTRLQAATLDEFEARNRQSQKLQAQFQLNVPYELVSESQVAELRVRDERGCTCLSAKYPNWLGPIGVSSVGFNSSREQALVYTVVEDCRGIAAGTYALLQKQGGAWKFLNVLNLGYELECSD